MGTLFDDDVDIFPSINLDDDDDDDIFPSVALGDDSSDPESNKESSASDDDHNHSEDDDDAIFHQPFVSLQQRRMSKLGYINIPGLPGNAGAPGINNNTKGLGGMRKNSLLGGQSSLLRRNSSTHNLGRRSSVQLGGDGGMRRNSSSGMLNNKPGSLLRRNSSAANLTLARNSSSSNLHGGVGVLTANRSSNNLLDHMMEEDECRETPPRETVVPRFVITSEMSPAKQRWFRAVQLLTQMTDPWEKFHLQALDVERCVRHRYHALKKRWTEETMYVKMQNEAFNRGAMRACFRLISHPKWTKDPSNCTELKARQKLRNYVAKRYMEDVEKDVYFEDVRLQMDAKLWGEEYNRHCPPKKVDIFQMSVIEFVDRPKKPLFHLENYIEGEYIKYNSNSGFVDDNMRLTPHAFSHFTFERSGHEMIVVDIQGVGDLWTDPQIHTSDGEGYGSGNLGTKGMALFFHSHVCNSICHKFGLSVFDLCPSEQEHFNKTKQLQQNAATMIRGCEQMVVTPSPTDRVDLTSFLARNRNRTISRSSGFSDVSEDDGDAVDASGPFSPHRQRSSDVSNGFGSLGSSLDPGSPLGCDIVQHLNRVRFQSESESEHTHSDADTIGEAEERRRFADFAKKQHRASCYSHEVQRRSGGSLINDSTLGMVHHDMAKYHEIGRFSENDNDIDWEAALFHEQYAANLGVMEAILTMAKLYLGMQTDVLVNCHVNTSDPENIDSGFNYMQSAAIAGDRAAMVYMAEAYASGNNLGTNRSKSFMDSIHWYEQAIKKCAEDDGGDFDGTMYTPVYVMKAKMAEMYLEGDETLERDPSGAGDLYNEAAEEAMNSMKGRIANKYYALAEEAYAQVEDEE